MTIVEGKLEQTKWYSNGLSFKLVNFEPYLIFKMSKLDHSVEQYLNSANGKNLKVQVLIDSEQRNVFML
ncbi:hypothetical protein C2869_03395 [Saccharobesus litoralis]|uniref:Uncharacterized protein n=1 Tax=Saccharobesus litoralis TaxID=2172099 RepID=A0A2S0VMW4_9ALTE|nr:hypothetical protein C2869_03395 [Saccharobesus litoralis]